MHQLHWELSILARAVAYTNLSHAASHLGISQPQLSRILKKLEEEFQVQLLDRTVKRKSGWMPAAQRLAEVYLKSDRNLQHEIQRAIGNEIPTRMSIALLEGLIPVATRLAHHIFETIALQEIEIDVYDLGRLEERFLRGEFDLILTSRPPGSHKFNFIRTIGHQVMALHNPDSPYRVLSTFEAGRLTMAEKKRQAKKRTLLSDSLEIKRSFIEDFSVSGMMPSELRKGPPSGRDEAVEALIVGKDSLWPSLWKEVTAFKL